LLIQKIAQVEDQVNPQPDQQLSLILNPVHTL